MSTILISYRREDTADVIGRIYDRLIRQIWPRDRLQVCRFEFPRVTIFGSIWTNQWLNATCSCGDWTGLGKETGQSRRVPGLMIHEDFVRIEIESALKCQIQVTPVLGNGPQSRRLSGSQSFGGRALRSHRRSSGSIPFLLPTVYTHFLIFCCTGKPHARHSAVRETTPTTANSPRSDAGAACCDRRLVAHIPHATGTGTARSFIEHIGAIGKGIEGLGDGATRRERQREPVVAGGRDALCDERGGRGSCPHCGRDVCGAVSEQAWRPGTPAPSSSPDEIVLL